MRVGTSCWGMSRRVGVELHRGMVGVEVECCYGWSYVSGRG